MDSVSTSQLCAATIFGFLRCRGSSPVERGPEKAGVGSSTLPPGTIFSIACVRRQPCSCSILFQNSKISRTALGFASISPVQRFLVIFPLPSFCRSFYKFSVRLRAGITGELASCTVFAVSVPARLFGSTCPTGADVSASDTAPLSWFPATRRQDPASRSRQSPPSLSASLNLRTSRSPRTRRALALHTAVFVAARVLP